jgi:hypothetical protein
MALGWVWISQRLYSDLLFGFDFRASALFWRLGVPERFLHAGFASANPRLFLIQTQIFSVCL